MIQRPKVRLNFSAGTSRDSQDDYARRLFTAGILIRLRDSVL